MYSICTTVGVFEPPRRSCRLFRDLLNRWKWSRSSFDRRGCRPPWTCSSLLAMSVMRGVGFPGVPGHLSEASSSDSGARRTGMATTGSVETDLATYLLLPCTRSSCGGRRYPSHGLDFVAVGWRIAAMVSSITRSRACSPTTALKLRRSVAPSIAALRCRDRR